MHSSVSTLLSQIDVSFVFCGQLQRPVNRSSHSKAERSHEEPESPELSDKKNEEAMAAPRREGLRPRRSSRAARLELSSQDYEDDDQNSSDREISRKGKGHDHYCLLEHSKFLEHMTLLGHAAAVSKSLCFFFFFGGEAAPQVSVVCNR